MNREALVKISEQIQQTDLNKFRIEDIYFTGILRQKAQISRIEDYIKIVGYATIWPKTVLDPVRTFLAFFFENFGEKTPFFRRTGSSVQRKMFPKNYLEFRTSFAA